MYRRYLLFFLLAFSCSLVQAQTWEVGAYLGGTGYMGDLNQVKPYKLTDPGIGAMVKRNLDQRWSLKLNFLHGKVQAKDADANSAYQNSRNLSFFSPVTELSLQTEFNFFNYLPGLSKKRYTPYLFTGLGAMMFNPKT